MSALATLKAKLDDDPAFRALFNATGDVREAIRVAKDKGIPVSVEDLLTYRKELMAVIGNPSFHLDAAHPRPLSGSPWSGGMEAWSDGTGGCSFSDVGCSSFSDGS